MSRSPARAWSRAIPSSGGDAPAAALKAYERIRRPRVERVVREAKQNLGIYDMRGLPATIRNAVLSRMSPERLLSRLDWLYGWRPE